ncbi:MAG: peptidase [Anaerolinea sp.]|nr:peptidase [Anaerolinea sp.]
MLGGMVDASRPKARTTKAAVGSQPRSAWFPVFAGSLIAITLSFIVLIFVVADKFGGDGGGVPIPGAGDPRPTATATADGATVSQPPTASQPPATVGPGDIDNTPLLPCNNILVPVDKNHRLGADCAPTDLVALPGSASQGGEQLMRLEAKEAFLELVAAASADGYRLYATSSYRSYQQQVITYQQNVAAGGQAYADRTSARAGHSEHQLGTTTDVASNVASFEGFNGTAEAKWLADNSWRFGFIVSYPPGKEEVTGYAREDWHIRYVGRDVAKKVRDSGLTLHEYLLK